MDDGRKFPTLGMATYLVPPDETSEAVYHALQVGYRLFDCGGEAYGGNEKQAAEGIGRWLRETNASRDEIIFTSKVWPTEFGYEKTLAAVDKVIQDIGPTLGRVDLFLVQSPEQSPHLRLETYSALQMCVERGKIGSIGVANYGVHHLAELLEWRGLTHRPVVNQVEINPWLQQQPIVEYCREHMIAVEAASPLILGKRFKDPQLLALSQKYHKTPAQLLIKWSLQRGFIPLPKSRDKDRIAENFAMADWELDSEDVKALGDATDQYCSVDGYDPTRCD